MLLPPIHPSFDVPAKKQQRFDPSEIFLTLGTATGYLASRNHSGAAEPGAEISLSFRAAAQGIMVLGSPGEGKTIGLMNPLALQALDHEIQVGVLAYDIKGSFAPTFVELARRAGREAKVIGIGPGTTPINCIGSLSPDAVGKILAAYMSRGSSSDNQFFINSSSQIVAASLALLRAQPEKYNLAEARRIPFVEAARAEAIAEAQAYIDASKLLPPTDPAEIELLDEVAYGINYFAEDFAALSQDKDTYGNVLSQLSTALSPFARRSLHESLCASGAGALDFSSLYDGSAMVVSMPNQDLPAVAELVYQLLSEQFATLVRRRSDMADGDPQKWRPIVLLIDEFQSVATPRWAELFALSRDQGLIPILAVQQYESISRVMTKEDDANLLFGNCGTKIGMSVGTSKSVDVFKNILGEAEYTETTESKSKPGMSPFHPGTVSKTPSQKHRAAIDGQVFRALTNDHETMTFQAICMSRCDGRSQDDVIQVRGMIV